MQQAVDFAVDLEECIICCVVLPLQFLLDAVIKIILNCEWLVE